MNLTFLVYRIKECCNVILHGLVRQCILADTIGAQHSLKTLTLFKDEAKEIDTLFKVQTKEKMISNTRKKQKL